MPSQAMQDAIDALRDRQKAGAGQAPATLDERRAGFVPGDRLHPVPDDVRVTEVTAGGVPAHWLTAPGADTGRVLLFLHGGGYELGSVRSDGELAARLGRASGMRVLFPEYRLAPSIPSPPPSSTSPCRSARACPTSTSSCSAPPRQPKPPSRSESSCELLPANCAHLRQTRLPARRERTRPERREKGS